MCDTCDCSVGKFTWVNDGTNDGTGGVRSGTNGRRGARCFFCIKSFFPCLHASHLRGI